MMINILRGISHSLTHQFELFLHHPNRFKDSEVIFAASVEKCSYDLVERRLEISLFDDEQGRVVEHIIGLSIFPEDDWTASISTFQRDCEGVARVERFSKLRLLSHHATRDYATAEATRHTIVVGYGYSELIR